MRYVCNIKISNWYYTRILLCTHKNDEKYSLKINILNSVFVHCSRVITLLLLLLLLLSLLQGMII